jgi:catechol 2,3-dioxygenase-like lactoylglutathione lyase family enzyme
MGLVTLVVRDYDEAIRFYVDDLGFTLVEDCTGTHL